MKKSTDKPDQKHEVGEHISLSASFEPEKTKDLGNGIVEAIITTSSIDRYRESLATEGIDTASYMNNPVVLYGHDYSGLPIGKTIKLTPFKNKIKAQFQLAVDEYPFASTVYAMIKSGYLNAVSIGGRVLDWNDDYTEILKMEMLEFSVVPVPANAEALITGRAFEEAVGKSRTEVKEEFQNFERKIVLDKLKGMPDNDLKDAIRSLKYLTARLEETVEDSLAGEQPTIHKRIVLKDAQAIAREAQKTIKIITFKPVEKD